MANFRNHGIILCRKVKGMQITGLDEQEVAKAAANTFANTYVEVGSADLFLPDIEKGELCIDGIEHPIYASTHYAYEDRLVNGNKTRYKVALTTILLKKDAYEVIYSSRGKYYVAYKTEEGIQFVLYEDFYALLKPLIHQKEEKAEA